jgi:histone acetyltransferase (RNA polymerase elongator complex component)
MIWELEDSYSKKTSLSYSSTLMELWNSNNDDKEEKIDTKDILKGKPIRRV